MDCGVEEYAAVEGVLWKVDDVAVENGRWSRRWKVDGRMWYGEDEMEMEMWWSSGMGDGVIQGR